MARGLLHGLIDEYADFTQNKTKTATDFVVRLEIYLIDQRA